MDRQNFEYYESLFKNACFQLCEDLKFDYDKLEFNNEEIEDEYYFRAFGEKDEKGFDFDVALRWSDDPRGSDVSLNINYSKGANPFYFRERIEYLMDHGDFLGRWAAWAVLNYRKNHNKADLDSLFYEADIQVYGLPDLSNPTRTEIEVFLTGAKTLNEEIMIYRFRHPEDSVRYRSFSYAFHFPTKDHVWIIFPRLGALDSGAAHRDYEQAEELINSLDSSKVTRKNFDIEYYDFSKVCAHEKNGYKMVPKMRFLVHLME